MNGFTRRVLLGGLCAATLSLGAAVTASAVTPDDIKAAGKIRIGMDVSLKPYAYPDASGAYVGADVTVAHMVADDLGVTLEVVPLTSANRIPYLVTDKVDIVISTLAKTPERAEVIDFTRPYSGSFVIVTAPADVPISGYADLAGRQIAVARGTTFDTIITENAPAGTEIIRFDGEDTSLTAISSGQVDVAAFNIARLKELQDSNPAKNFEVKFRVQNVEFRIGVKKGDDAMRTYLNDLIAKHMADGSLNAAFKEYIGADLPDDLPTE